MTEGPDGMWIDDFVRQAKRDVFPTLNLALEINRYDHLEVLGLRVPVTHRGEGHGRRLLEKICAEADRRGLILTCSPTSEWGSDRERLVAGLIRYGFVPAQDSGVTTHNTYVRPCRAQTT